jgi:hypothetical protein
MTLQRERRAELHSKEGFSVVAPKRMIRPLERSGRNKVSMLEKKQRQDRRGGVIEVSTSSTHLSI